MNAPSFEEVQTYIVDQGGNENCARLFYNDHSATGWMCKSRPIINWRPLANVFIRIFKKYGHP